VFSSITLNDPAGKSSAVDDPGDSSTAWPMELITCPAFNNLSHRARFSNRKQDDSHLVVHF